MTTTYPKDRLEELRQRTQAALAAYNAKKAALADQAERPAAAGDGYLFYTPLDIHQVWVVVATHADDSNLLFTVPADQHPLVGLCDVVVGQEDYVLRCGHGLWLHRDELTTPRRVVIFPSTTAAAARAKLAQIVRGKLDGLPAQWEAEDDPEYEEWLDEVSHATEILAATLRR